MEFEKDYKLREVRSEDLEQLYNWRNADYIRPFMNNDGFIQREEHYKWFEGIKGDKNKIARLCLYNEKPIGLVQFSLDYKNQTCEWGFYIGDNTSPRGSGRIMGTLALDFIFQEVGMRKVCAQVLDFNVKSLSYHNKLGFHEEGRFLQQVKRNNQFVDVVHFGLFKEKWKRSRKTSRLEVLNRNDEH